MTPGFDPAAWRSSSCCLAAMKSWRKPWKIPWKSHENGGTPSYHPFTDGIFPEINHPFWGTPFMETPKRDPVLFPHEIPVFSMSLWKFMEAKDSCASQKICRCWAIPHPPTSSHLSSWASRFKRLFKALTESGIWSKNLRDLSQWRMVWMVWMVWFQPGWMDWRILNTFHMGFWKNRPASSAEGLCFIVPFWSFLIHWAYLGLIKMAITLGPMDPSPASQPEPLSHWATEPPRPAVMDLQLQCCSSTTLSQTAQRLGVSWCFPKCKIDAQHCPAFGNININFHPFLPFLPVHFCPYHLCLTATALVGVSCWWSFSIASLADFGAGGVFFLFGESEIQPTKPGYKQ